MIENNYIINPEVYEYPLIPYYIQFKILKYLWNDNSLSLKYKLSLNCINRKYFHFISKLFIRINKQYLEDKEFQKKLDNTEWFPLKYPMTLKTIEFQFLDYFVRHFKMDTLLNIFKDSLTSLSIDHTTETEHNNNFNKIVLPIVQSLLKLKEFRLNTTFEVDFKPLFFEFYKNNNINFTTLHLEVGIINNQDLANYLSSSNIKLESLKLSGAPGSNLSMDLIDFGNLKKLTHLKLNNCIVKDSSKLFVGLSKCSCLKSLKIKSVPTNFPDNNDEFSYQQDKFNREFKKFYQILYKNLVELELPFLLKDQTLIEMFSNPQLESLAFVPGYCGVTFNTSLKRLTFKHGYPLEVFKEFVVFNLPKYQESIQHCCIQSLKLYELGEENVSNLLEFLQNSSLNSLELEESMSFQNINSLFAIINQSHTIRKLNFKITENSPSLSLVNYSLDQLSSNQYLRAIKIYLYYYFHGFDKSKIESDTFKLLDCQDHYLLSFIK
ncbi:hypothetical protein DLAC_11835 [Tieghemostelium lacteum]|uniref:Uncharacterized protein n=1 Tax=Tieghemostelium lacteum TaxID=361077 RepID=A0A151Z2T5_TIELA|nr:hypothetical protein DLAC_11835 [Tieghemostelium lacteum]|eukprot:KYQ88258.1 hypothetical protein DLAC_11835 [Tieghemostelium lacteum]